MPEQPKPKIETVTNKAVEFSNGQIVESLNTAYPGLTVPANADITFTPGKVRFNWTEKS